MMGFFLYHYSNRNLKVNVPLFFSSPEFVLNSVVIKIQSSHNNDYNFIDHLKQSIFGDQTVELLTSSMNV